MEYRKFGMPHTPSTYLSTALQWVHAVQHKAKGHTCTWWCYISKSV